MQTLPTASLRILNRFIIVVTNLNINFYLATYFLCKLMSVFCIDLDANCSLTAALVVELQIIKGLWSQNFIYCLYFKVRKKINNRIGFTLTGPQS